MSIVILASLAVLATITTGIYLLRRDTYPRPWMKHALRINLALGALLLLAFSVQLVSGVSFAQAETTPAAVNGLGLIAAALSTGMATIGAGLAVSAVGSSAIGAISEDPSNLGRTLIFVGLSEGISIFGLIISILILGKI
ncbi:MAG TPA: ATPase [Tissierellia bacterium]|nr:ATPase [Tissierellia bacterium]